MIDQRAFAHALRSDNAQTLFPQLFDTFSNCPALPARRPLTGAPKNKARF